jgi:hypothetical protein
MSQSDVIDACIKGGAGEKEPLNEEEESTEGGAGILKNIVFIGTKIEEVSNAQWSVAQKSLVDGFTN